MDLNFRALCKLSFTQLSVQKDVVWHYFLVQYMTDYPVIFVELLSPCTIFFLFELYYGHFKKLAKSRATLTLDLDWAHE